MHRNANICRLRAVLSPALRWPLEWQRCGFIVFLSLNKQSGNSEAHGFPACGSVWVHGNHLFGSQIFFSPTTTNRWSVVGHGPVVGAKNGQRGDFVGPTESDREVGSMKFCCRREGHSLEFLILRKTLWF